MTLPALCLAVGLPWSPATCAPGLSPWDGRVLHRLRRGGRPWGPPGLWHEVAHWLLCPPELRTHAGFGLGCPQQYDDDGTWGPVVMHDVTETMAILLQQRIGDAEGYARWLGHTGCGSAWERALAQLERAT